MGEIALYASALFGKLTIGTAMLLNEFLKGARQTPGIGKTRRGSHCWTTRVTADLQRRHRAPGVAASR